MPHLNENTKAYKFLDFPKARKEAVIQMWKECFQSTAYLRYSHKRSHYVIQQVITFVLLFFPNKKSTMSNLRARSPQVLQPLPSNPSL